MWLLPHTFLCFLFPLPHVRTKCSMYADKKKEEDIDLDDDDDDDDDDDYDSDDDE